MLRIDVIALVDGNIIHILIVGTEYQNRSFLGNMCEKTNWAILRRHGIDVYAGAPGCIYIDTGSNFKSTKFKDNECAMGTIVQIAHTKSHYRIGMVEKNLTCLRAVHKMLQMILPYTAKEDRLSMAYRAINDAPNSDTIISFKTLVYEIYPKISGARDRGTILEK